MNNLKTPHSWLKKINLHYVPGQANPMMEEFVDNLLNTLEDLGHTVQDAPDENTDVALTSLRYGKVLNWRRALMFTGRILLKLKHTPVAVTLIHITPSEFEEITDYFKGVLAKEPLDPEDFRFEGLAEESPKVLIEQGKRGGPILSLIRLLQAQSKCIRIILVVGEDTPDQVYHIDLVGAHPTTDYSIGEDAFYRDIALRLVTYESTWEITEHEVVGDLIPAQQWKALPTVKAMQTAGREIGERNFFTEMLVITELANVPAINESIASQYSEGCFATWDPEIEGMIATVTGSARPVDKGNISEDELAIIVGVRPDRRGAQVRHVEGRENIKPSSEAVEMMDMDYPLPQIQLSQEWHIKKRVPVIRSKLHGHRGVKAYNPERVEYVPLDPPYYNFLVSCATEAQARGIKAAFARAESLLNPDDPRQVAFTVLPGHGVVITEKWVAGKAPLQTIWEYMDAGHIEIDNLVPQGEMGYAKDEDGRMALFE